MIKYSDIQSVHLEISTLCNASCPLCPRNLAGYDTDLGYPLHNMTLAEAKIIFTESFLKNPLQRILINGNFGDFVMNPESIDIVDYIFSVRPKIIIEISTNGSARNWWQDLARIPKFSDKLIVNFALDGLEDTHSLYRRNTHWKTVIKNAETFINAGGKAVWRMIEFDHNRHQIDECRRLSQKMGFSDFIISYDGRDKGPVYDRRGIYQYKIGSDKHFIDRPYPNSPLIWESWQFNSIIDRNTIPIKSSINCYTKRMNEIYITATGEVYPCCWLGFYPHLQLQRSWQLHNDQIDKIATNNNALEFGIERAVEWFNSVEASWQKQSYADGRLFKCDQYCGH